MLSLVPEALREHKVDAEGIVTILINRTKSPFMLRIMKRMNRTPYFTIELDEIGSKVWTSIDGKCTVANICDRLQENVEGELVQTQERVVRFLSGLFHGKHIRFMTPELE